MKKIKILTILKRNLKFIKKATFTYTAGTEMILILQMIFEHRELSIIYLIFAFCVLLVASVIVFSLLCIIQSKSEESDTTVCRDDE